MYLYFRVVIEGCAPPFTVQSLSTSGENILGNTDYGLCTTARTTPKTLSKRILKRMELRKNVYYNEQMAREIKTTLLCTLRNREPGLLPFNSIHHRYYTADSQVLSFL